MQYNNNNNEFYPRIPTRWILVCDVSVFGAILSASEGGCCGNVYDDCIVYVVSCSYSYQYLEMFRRCHGSDATVLTLFCVTVTPGVALAEAKPGACKTDCFTAWKAKQSGEAGARGSQGAYIYYHHWRNKDPGSTLMRWQSDTVTSDKCMIDVDPNVFVFWKLSWMPCKLRDKNQSVQLSVNIIGP